MDTYILGSPSPQCNLSVTLFILSGFEANVWVKPKSLASDLESLNTSGHDEKPLQHESRLMVSCFSDGLPRRVSGVMRGDGGAKQ